MASRNTKADTSKQTRSRSVHTAPARPRGSQTFRPSSSVQSAAIFHRTVPRKYSCIACAKCFSTQTELAQHKKDKHGAKPPEVIAYKHLNPVLQNKKQVSCSKCPSCAKVFPTSRELEQHRKDKHQFDQQSKVTSLNQSHLNKNMFTCSYCGKGFSGSRELTQHTKDGHGIDERQFTHAIKSTTSANIFRGVTCNKCDKKFSNANELSQHQRDKHKIDPPRDRSETPNHAHICQICSSHFLSHAALMQHKKDKHLLRQSCAISESSPDKRKPYISKFKCSKCPRMFPSNVQLVQHISDSHGKEHDAQFRKHESSKATAVVKSNKMTKVADIAVKRNERKKVIDDYYAKKVDIDKDEKKISLRLVNETLSIIMSHVTGQEGGNIYCPNHIKAGSFPVNTKIGKPDEFDTNICLKLGQEDVKVSLGKTINYSYGQNEHATNMNVKCELNKTGSSVKVPNNYAIASTNNDKLPRNLLHGNDIIPREIRYDLYQKIKTAKDHLGLNYVDLSRSAHGPALTLTIHPPKRFKIQHQISVDITLSLPCNIPIAKWPRRETKQAFNETLIKDVKETGTHLVPKKDEFWAVSYSKAERALFSRLDEGNGCRKFVYKMLKKYMQSCKSRSRSGLQGLSSHILKTQILWSCEQHRSPEFWHFTNRDECLIETLTDLEKTLRSAHLPDYFDTSVDILKGKDASVCTELANYLRDKRNELEL